MWYHRDIGTLKHILFCTKIYSLFVCWIICLLFHYVLILLACRAGGKYGPEKDPTSKAFDLSKNSQKEELQKASEVLLGKSSELRAFDWSQEPDMNDIDIDDDEGDDGIGIGRGNDVTGSPKSSPIIGGLSSTLWTELLD